MEGEKMEACFNGVYLPMYIPEMQCWGVETAHGIETGDISYVVDEFCWDSVIYYFYTDLDKSYPDHVHGSFESVIRALINHPESFSIEGFENLYSLQERRVLMNVKEAIRQVKERNRPLTREEAEENRRRIMEQLKCE